MDDLAAVIQDLATEVAGANVGLDDVVDATVLASTASPGNGDLYQASEPFDR
jgi:hypothetical protein